MRTTLTAFALLLAIALGACSGTSSTSTASASPTTIAAIGEALTAADQLALAYVQLPACPSGAMTTATGAVCSDPNISKQIKVAAQAAYAAYKAAEVQPATAALLTAAEQALAAYTVLVPPNNK
jgi:ABC-type enterochelin transport system substrate-binding protein